MTSSLLKNLYQVKLINDYFTMVIGEKWANRIFKYKGKRIRASDKILIYQTGLGAFSFFTIVVLILFQLRSILQTNWETNTFEQIFLHLQTDYCWGSLITALFCMLCYRDFVLLIQVRLNNEYEEYAIHDYKLPCDVDKYKKQIGFAKVLQS